MANIFTLKFYIISSFINFATPFVLGFLLLKNYRAKPNRLFSVFSFTVAFWAWFYSMWLLTEDKIRAEFYLRTCMVGVLFMPSLFIHFVTTFLNKPKSRGFYRFNYILSVLFTLTVYTSLYAHTPTPHLMFYWLHPGPIFHLALTHFIIIVGYAFWLMFKELRIAKGVFRNQLMYVTVGTFIGYAGGSTNYFCWYRIPIPPFLNACVAVYVLSVTFAIVRYKLLDIHFVIRKMLTNLIISFITSTGMICISIFLPSLISKIIIFIALGILLSLYLPTFKIKTENTVNHLLYKGKYDYLDRLEKFVEKMALIPKEEDLIKDTTMVLTRDMYTERVALLTRDNITGDYFVRHKINIDVTSDFKLPQDTKIANWLKVHKRTFVLEEEEKILTGAEIEIFREELEPLQAKVCIPARLDSDLIGIIALGNKTTGEMYTHQDLGLLERLGTQLAVALDYKRVEAQLRKEQELAGVGIMAMEISHELRNLLQPVYTFVELIPDRLEDRSYLTGDFSKIALERIRTTSYKLNDIMFFGKPRPPEFTTDVDLNKLLDSNLLANDGMIKRENIEIVKEYSDIPLIKADSNQLIHLLNNLIINAVDAMKERGGKLRVRTKVNDNITKEMKDKSNKWIRIEVKDDGAGMPEKVLNNLFTPFVTTKSSGGIQRSGTGLGLSVVKKVVDGHKGYIHVHTKEDKGTTFVIDLPVDLNPAYIGDESYEFET